MNDEPIELDPIEPTVIGPGLVAVPMTPTVWDDLPDGQHVLTPDGRVWRRRGGLWYLDPWWQGEDAEQIKAICENPDKWAFNLSWTRAQVEDAYGPMEPIMLPEVER